ncbi:MAG: 1-acyl-sn-glycerol-3-phosphate acyltransferase [Clostridia bacterium]|nr:1-acyl-sn-glycerol-3-phosphate acyltransferase [Clostridia bacterium]
MAKQTIPVFYACDDNYIKYTCVSLWSLKTNASRLYDYDVHILHAGMDINAGKDVAALAEEGFNISFDDVTEYIDTIRSRIPVRDYFSITTYYRFFIAEMFQEYDKAVYIDSDTIVAGDISDLYRTDMKDAYLAVCQDRSVIDVPEFGEYVEKCLGVSRYNYFQAGMMLINCDRFRTCYILDKFIQLLHTYHFTAAQDQDYLNVICKDHVLYLDRRWNTETGFSFDFPIEDAKILHYNMANKPWYYPDAPYAEIFWKYASETSLIGELKKECEEYTDEERERDAKAGENLMSIVISETEREDNYLNRLNRVNRSSDRVAVLEKIAQYEREGRFGEDVEEDPPSRVLMPDEIEYVRKGFYEKIKTKFAFTMARRFVNNLIDEKKLIIKEIKGIENFNTLKSGAVITCNHFNAFDSFAIQFAYEASNQTDRKFYRVIKEGNYTSFPGFYGFLMRHCNTLPLSSNTRTLTKFVAAVNGLLKDGSLVLVYPEQSMWWNYRKPKPLKTGAFVLAARNKVPVLPCFITMSDSEIMGDDGFYVQEYTINIGKPIYPDEKLTYRENVEKLMDENFACWKDIYESFYNLPLEYTTENKDGE